ncbi:MAG: bifunctional 2-polyprenyl-6-hydroxyphenol methylase/3-demethylubiquinol 3-O-methyltransferase UbiG, partial [Alphaproteobacteria bacterium]|nr:bifunctional 2-polyprenyl-6-hydroxyphenol methylase/3-demethylubiquinol 3-O-methyltransferase UbiG [Alphaproteobacteria bacterium]
MRVHCQEIDLKRKGDHFQGMAATQKLFDDLAPRWWDDTGPFAPLHRLNPVRVRYVQQQAACQNGRPLQEALRHLNILDVGCGGGLLCEPMARLGARVMGIDAAPEAIVTAQKHAAGEGLEIDYRRIDLAALAQQKKQFDVITAMEVIEHVDDAHQFVRQLAAVLRPNGVVIFSTLNRTMKSLWLGKIAAEYVLGLVPRGTHDWKKFVKPSELMAMAEGAGLAPHDISGLIMNPITGDFSVNPADVSINYFAA